MAAIRRSSRAGGLAGLLDRLRTTCRNPLTLLPPEQLEAFLAVQLESTRPAYSGVLLVGAFLLLVLAGLEALGLTPGIGYPILATALGAALLAGCALAIVRIENDLPLSVTMLVYGCVLAALLSLSLPPHHSSNALAFRTGLFDLFPIAALALTVRRSAVLLIIAFVAVIAVLRIWSQGAPASGAAIYWLTIVTSVVFGLMLRRFRFAFAVQAFLARNELRRQAWTDALTGLLNRHGWSRESAKLLAGARRTHGPLSAVFFDVDHFKRINDTHGHDTGDAILRTLARTLEEMLPPGAIAARLGGEEFIALLPDEDISGGAAFAEATRAAFAASAREHGARVSAGVAQWRRRESLGQLMRRADKSLYAAKKGGRDRVVLAR